MWCVRGFIRRDRDRDGRGDENGFKSYQIHVLFLFSLGNKRVGGTACRRRKDIGDDDK